MIYNIHDDGFYDFILKLLKIEVKVYKCHKYHKHLKTIIKYLLKRIWENLPVRYQKFVWSQRLFLFSTDSASDSFGSATDHGPKILRFVLPESREKMSTYSVQEK